MAAKPRFRGTAKVTRVYTHYGFTHLKLSDGRKVQLCSRDPQKVSNTIRVNWDPMMGPYARYPMFQEIGEGWQQAIRHAMARHPQCL